MPEGDTVWLTAKRLDQALAGRALTIFELRVPQLATVDLRGAIVTAVVPRGKHLLTRFDDGSTLHSHLRMDGSWYLTAAGVRPSRYPDHLIRARLGNADWLATGYRIHDLRLVATAHEQQVIGHLGPDLLDAEWNQAALADAVARLRAEPSRPIGEALLDQRLLAGVGNLYKSEALFMQRVDPWLPVGEVPDLPALVTRAHDLLYANREHPEQSTTGRLGRGQQHWVYERRGEPCRRCRQPIRRAEQGAPPRQRSTYWCPACQARRSD
jgi:endonuclease VIII